MRGDYEYGRDFDGNIHNQYMRSVGGLMQAVELVARRLSDFDSYVNSQDDEDATPCREAISEPGIIDLDETQYKEVE